MPDRGDDQAETEADGGGSPRTEPLPESHHRDIQGGAARAAIFGVSDGLVTNVSLILGVVGAHTGVSFIRLAGIAGLISGACSMAAGEYVSMSAQKELLERELEAERLELHRHPTAERRELARLYERRGIDPDMAHELAGAMMRDPEMALETHAREELGVDPSSLGSPWAAAASSFVAFAVGALIPLAPWFLVAGPSALWLSIGAGVAAAVATGLGLSYFTGRSAFRSALRQLIVAILAAGVTFLIGRIVGVHGS